MAKTQNEVENSNPGGGEIPAFSQKHEQMKTQIHSELFLPNELTPARPLAREELLLLGRHGTMVLGRVALLWRPWFQECRHHVRS